MCNRFPRQRIMFIALPVDNVSGWVFVIPSHHTSPSGVTPTLVKMVFLRMVAMALGFVLILVPGATPKYPYSGLMAYSLPSLPGLIQAISSPTVVTFQPFHFFRRDHHRKIGFTAGTWKCGSHICLFPFWIFYTKYQHMFGKPSFFFGHNGSNAQRKTFFTQQCIATVT